MQRVTVVSGLILNESQQILMALRRADGVLPNAWEIPGGKVEEEEQFDQALMREMKEELGVEVVVGALLSVAPFRLERKLNILLFPCTVVSGELKPLESQELKWIDLRDTHLEKYTCVPSFYSWYADIEDFIHEIRLRKAYSLCGQ